MDREEAAFRAARDGDVARLGALLDEDASLLEARGESGATLLHVAAERDHVEVARLLLDRGAELEVEAEWGDTPFEWAAAMASDAVAALLLERGAQRWNLWTAAALGMQSRVEAAFEGGVIRPGQARVPSPGADLSGWPEDTPYRRGAALDDAFHIAARNGRREVAEWLLERGANVGATGYFGATALHWAAVSGREEIVRWLLSVGADPTRRDPKFDATPATWAQEGGHDEIADLLDPSGILR